MELFRQASRSGRRLGLGVGAVLLAVISASCTSPPPPPPTGHPPQPNQTYRFEDEYNTFKATSTDPTKRPWFCHALGSGAHEHAASNHVEQGTTLPVPAYEGLVRGALSWDDCLANARAFDQALTFAQQYPTVGSLPAGFRQTVQYLAGMGTHHQNFGTGGSTVTFNPNRPNTLQYDGNGPNARLVGMSWLIRGSETSPPAGFAGANDVWHYHRALCSAPGGPGGGVPNIVGNNITDARCRQLGGVNAPVGLWMVHAWIVPNWQFQTDVNSGLHPCLLETGVAPAADECWAHAQHDHSLEPGDHDAHDH
jgi:hypothetical protein